MQNLHALMKLAGLAITGIVTLGALQWIYRATRPQDVPRRNFSGNAPAP